jgi:hypothetical protein
MKAMLTNSVLQIPLFIAKRFKLREGPSKFLQRHHKIKLLQNHILSLPPAVGLAAAKSLANLGIDPFVRTSGDSQKVSW